MIRLVLPLVLLSTLGAGPLAAQASQLWSVEGPDAVDRVETREGRFVATYVRFYGSDGWRVEVASVEIDADARRIVAHLDETPPATAGSVSHTAIPIEIDLGAPGPGRWLLETRIRRDGAVLGTAAAIVLEATDDGLSVVETPLSIEEIEATDDDRPAFTALLATGPQACRVDGVETGDGRTVVRLTTIDGPPTPTWVDLGPLPIGPHRLVVETRAGDADHRLTRVFLLAAEE